MLAQFYAPIVGGEEQHVRTLSHELVAHGHDVSVITLWHEGLAEHEIDHGVRVHRIRGMVQRVEQLFAETGRRHAPPFPDPGLVRAMWRIIASERPDIVHAHNWLVHSFVPIKKRSGARLVVTLHDYSLVCVQKRLMQHGRVLCSGPGMVKCIRCATDFYGPLKGGITVAGNGVMHHWEHRAVDAFVPVSHAVAEYTGVRARGLPYRVIPNFVPDGSVAAGPVDAAQEYLAQLPDEPFLLFVGDLTRDKGLQVLLDAYEALQSRVPLVLIGRPTEHVPERLPPGVLILGPWPHDAVMLAWQRCMLGILPSLVPETFGIVMIEAMACGRPVISSRIGGLPDVVTDGETGFLVPAGDARALRDALATLIADPALRDRMGTAGRMKVTREFEARAVIPRIEQLYRDVLSGINIAASPREIQT